VRIYENRMLRRIFGLKTDKMVGGWRKVVHNSYFLPNINKIVKASRMRWTWCEVLIRERTLRRCRRKNNIKTDIRKRGLVGWINLAQGSAQGQALVNPLTNLQIL
jgi:hypothetical protein